MNGWIDKQSTPEASGLMRLASTALILALCLSGLAFAKPADDGKLHIIVFGAHPDDCEIDAGGYGSYVGR